MKTIDDLLEAIKHPVIFNNNKDIFSENTVKLEIYRVGYAEEPQVVILNKDEKFEVKQRGEVSMIWKDVKTHEVLVRQHQNLTDAMSSYFVKFPNEFEIDLPF
jgi:hypothetical protein